MFVHLHSHTIGSISDCILTPKTILSWANAQGVTAHAMTDHGCLTGVYPFYFAATQSQVRPVFGIEVYFDAREDEDGGDRLAKSHLVLLARNLTGFRNLIRLNNEAWQKNLRPPRYATITWDMLERYHEGLMCLTACVGSPIALAVRRGRVDRAEELFKRLYEIFGENFRPEVGGHPIPDQPQVNEAILAFARRAGLPPVLTNDCHYAKSEDWFIHNLYIKTGLKNPKTFTYSASCFYLKNEEEMRRMEFPAAFSDETARIAESCTAYEELRQRLSKGFSKPRRTSTFFPVRVVSISARMAVGDAARVLRVSETLLDRIRKLIGTARSLDEAHRRSGPLREIARRYPWLWRGAKGLEGLPRYVEPNFDACVEADAEQLSHLPLRVVDGLPVIDVEAPVLRQLGFTVRPARTANKAPTQTRQAYYRGLRHWWNDEFESATENLERAVQGGDCPREAFLRLAESLIALKRISLAKNILRGVVSDGSKNGSEATEQANRMLRTMERTGGPHPSKPAAVGVDHLPDFSALYLNGRIGQDEVSHAMKAVEKLLESNVGVVVVMANAEARRSAFFLPLLIGIDAYLRRYRGRIYVVGPALSGRLERRWFRAYPTYGEVAREIPHDVALTPRPAPDLAFHRHPRSRTIRHSQLIRSRIRQAVLRDAARRSWRTAVSDISGEFIWVEAPRTKMVPDRVRVELELGREAAVSESPLIVQAAGPGIWRTTAPVTWNLRPLRSGRRKRCRMNVDLVSCTPGGGGQILTLPAIELSLSGCVLEGGKTFADNESVALQLPNGPLMAAWKIRTLNERSIWSFYDYEPSVRTNLVRRFGLTD